MKKAIIFFTIFLSLLLIYEIFFNFLKASHEVEYNITNDDITYIIKEDYKKEMNDDYYYLKVKRKDSDDSYLFSVQNIYNKRKNIVKKVHEYAKDDVSCMTLTLVDNKNSEGICIKDNKLYSYYSLKSELNIKELDDNLGSYDREVDSETYDEIDVELKYLDKNEMLIFHLPKEIVIFDYEKSHAFTFASKDNYKNKYGVLLNQYYIIPRINDEPEFEDYLVYDLKNRKLDSIPALTHISTNSYYNGIHNNELYITDVSNLRQYRLDPVVKSIKLIANTEEDAYIYENDEEKRKNIYEITSKEVKFTETSDLYKDVNYDKIFIQKGYAYYLKDNVFYKVYEKYVDKPVYMFKVNNPVNIKVRGNTIYYIEYNKLKKYNDKGINTLMEYSELINNYDNIYDIYIRQ